MKLETAGAKTSEVDGNFTLILYRGSLPGGIDCAAFLDDEADRYSFEVYAPDHEFTTIRGLSGREAVERAEDFVSRNSSFMRSLLSRITDDNDHVMGYELRPLYQPFVYGTADILDINYDLRGVKIIIRISPDPSVRNSLTS
ncbi:MAG TPA: hypothetical protein VN328_00830 [Thermodesulfovibrionales bacterium]|nr:hypothetical protein [Thermodesulfovibrionales bacterium]